MTNQQSSERRLVKSIFNLKLSNLLLILFFVGIAIFGLRVYLEFNAPVESEQRAMYSVLVLLTEWLAGAAISTVIVGFAYEWLVREETQRSLELFLTERLKAQETAIVDSMIIEIPKTLLLDKEVQTKLLAGNNELIDQALRNFINLRLGDKIMGDGLYEGLLSKSLSYPERYIDYRNEIIVSSIHDDNYPEVVKKRFFDVTLNVRYRTRLQTNEIRFARALNTEQYNLRIRDLKYRYVLLFPENKYFPSKSAVFDVLSFRIDNEAFIPREIEEEGAHEWIIDSPELLKKINTEVTIQYSILTKTYRYGHSFTANIVKPTQKSLFIFNYAQSDIVFATAYDFFVSSKVASIYKTPANDPQMIFVELDAWSFPKGGVAFAWTLQEDLHSIQEAERKESKDFTKTAKKKHNTE